MKETENRRRGPPSVLLLALSVVAAPCLVGCAKSERGLTSYRDEQVALPQAKSGLNLGAQGAPTGKPCFINVRRDGTLWTRRGDTPTAPEDLPRLIAEADANKGCLVLRCDRKARWDSVEPLLIMLARAQVPRFWFCVENQGEAFLDYRLPAKLDLARGPGLIQEMWIHIRCSADKGAPPAPHVFVHMRRVPNWDDWRQTLSRYATIPGVLADPVVLCIGNDALFDWVIRVMDDLRRAGFRVVWFHAPHPEWTPDVGTDWIDPPSSTPVIGIPYRQTGPYRGHQSVQETSTRAEPALSLDELPIEDVPIQPTLEELPSEIRPPGYASSRVLSTVTAALNWLAKAQEEDGSWSTRRWGGTSERDVGVTGLSLLAFMSAGYTQTKGQFKATVEKGLAFLRASQKADGSFPSKSFDEHGIATLAASEAYSLTMSPEMGRMAQRAVDYIVKVQPEHGGFGPGGGVAKAEGDMLVTAWQILAIESAMLAELHVPEEAIVRSRAFLRNTYRGSGASSRLASSNDPEPLATALGMYSRMLLDGSGDGDEIRAAADWLRAHAQKNGSVGQGKDRFVGDLDYTYFSAAAMFRLGGEYWNDWNKAFRPPLVKAQVHQVNDAGGRFVRGSWDPAKHYLGEKHGRVYTTAMALLSLEVYYRFLPIYRR